MSRNLYTVPDLSDSDWEEIHALLSNLITGLDEEDQFERPVWWAIAQMCLGKAELIANGHYGDDEEKDLPWTIQLRTIAGKIMAYFTTPTLKGG